MIFQSERDPRLDWKMKDHRSKIARHLADCETCGPAHARATRKGRVASPEKLCPTGRELIADFGRMVREHA